MASKKGLDYILDSVASRRCISAEDFRRDDGSAAELQEGGLEISTAVRKSSFFLVFVLQLLIKSFTGVESLLVFYFLYRGHMTWL